jgi:hypothetical protein
VKGCEKAVDFKFACLLASLAVAVAQATSIQTAVVPGLMLTTLAMNECEGATGLEWSKIARYGNSGGSRAQSTRQSLVEYGLFNVVYLLELFDG